MSVNLSHVSATTKTPVSDVSAKASAESTESKGFLETLTDAFAGKQKPEKVATESTVVEEKERADVGSTSSANVSDELLAQESQESVSDGTHDFDEISANKPNATLSEEVSLQKASNSTPLEHDVEAIEKVKSTSVDTSNPSNTMDVKSTMGEGQQLLGRIEQANQTLNASNASIDSGKVLPQSANLVHSFHEQATVSTHLDELALNEKPSVHSLEQAQMIPGQDLEPILDNNGQPIDVDKLSPEFAAWQELAKQASHPTAKSAVSGEVANDLSPLLTDVDGSNIDALPRVSLDELEVIDTKLAQGKPLTQQEAQIIEGLKQGTITADIPEQDLAQFVALPNDIKQILAEQQVQHNLTRQAGPMAVSQQIQHTAAQVPQPQAAHSGDKVALSSTPDTLIAAQVPTSLQGVKDGEISQKVMNAALSTGALKATADKQDKPDLQHGFAGQLQAMAGQQGINVQQQARIDAAQQAQLPLQLTKELANEQVAEKVQMMMSKNLKNLDIRLDPPELGRMQIRMTMNNDVANVHFTVNNPQARDIIEQTLPRLREMLAQQGMQLADSSVQQQNSGQQQGRFTAEQHGQSAQSGGFSGQSEEGFESDVNLDLNVASKRDGISFYA
ncbi:flagellar hook-length control protein FliK [Vibrio alginolyticus]